MLKDYLYSDLTHRIVGLSMDLHNDLGSGFLEKIYENGLMNELKAAGMKADNQVQLEVIYKNDVLGKYTADIIVENKVILELKAVDHLTDAHKAQVISYLRTTGYLVGLLINFGSDRVEHKRYVNVKELEKFPKPNNDID